jgi:hypothetical protein
MPTSVLVVLRMRRHGREVLLAVKNMGGKPPPDPGALPTLL